MRKLNEQWIEVIDGQEHMLKAVLPSLCYCCEYNIYKEVGQVKCQNGEQCVTQQGHVKDLGILNEEGCLPDERTGLYPRIEEAKDNVQVFKWSCIVSSNDVYIRAHGSTKQQAIDAWNRRM